MRVLSPNNPKGWLVYVNVHKRDHIDLSNQLQRIHKERALNKEVWDAAFLDIDEQTLIAYKNEFVPFCGTKKGSFLGKKERFKG